MEMVGEVSRDDSNRGVDRSSEVSTWNSKGAKSKIADSGGLRVAKQPADVTSKSAVRIAVGRMPPEAERKWRTKVLPGEIEPTVGITFSGSGEKMGEEGGREILCNISQPFSCNGVGIYVTASPLQFDTPLGIGGLDDNHGVMHSPDTQFLGYFRLTASGEEHFEYLFVGRAPGCNLPIPCPWPESVDPVIERVESTQPPEWPWTTIWSILDQVRDCLQ